MAFPSWLALLRTCQAYIFSVDQNDNDLYRSGRRNKSGVDLNELRRLRLLAIKEELVRMTQPPSRGK